MPIARRHLAMAAALMLGAFGAMSRTPALAQAAEAAAVTQAVEGLSKAMLAADKARLEALLADQLSYGHSSGRLESKAAFLDVVAGKKTIYKSIALTEPSVAVAGPNAIVRHVMAVETESDGKPGSAKIGVLQVWQKQDGHWRLLARQAFRI